MPTRRQNPNAQEFRQDAFASSPEYERGLLGNVVAKRCEKLSDHDAIAVLWWLQQISWREGGLEKFAGDFLVKNQRLVGTASMHRFGIKPDSVYNADQVRAVRSEIRGGLRGEFRLRGELNRLRPTDVEDSEKDVSVIGGVRYYSGKENPDSYPVKLFFERCRVEPYQLAAHFKELLVNPQIDPTAGVWNMPGLWNALYHERERELADAGGRVVQTEVTQRIFDELDFALEMRTFILIEGREGIGKSEAARAWCERNVGRVVFVRLESGTDETTLYRSIAQKIGTACSYTNKAVEMRARIQDALQPGHLMLVIDEAHFLWPQSERSVRSAPKRLDWLRTAIIDFGVPVALISTPQHFERSCERFRKGGWNSLQIQRRLARTVPLPLPMAIPAADVRAVARSYFPAVDDALINTIAALARASVGFLTTIKHLRQRVDWLAKKRQAAESAVIGEALRDMGFQAAGRPFSSKPQAVVKAPLSRAQGLPESQLGGNQARALEAPQRRTFSTPVVSV